MSDEFEPPRPGARPARPASRPRHGGRRRPSPLLLTAIVLVVLFLVLSLFAGIWTDKLWFDSLGYAGVFTKLLWTRVALFLVFGLLMAADRRGQPVRRLPAAPDLPAATRPSRPTSSATARWSPRCASGCCSA